MNRGVFMVLIIWKRNAGIHEYSGISFIRMFQL